MPIYEYRCDRCGTTFDRLVRLSAADLPRCPSCGADAAQRLVSRIAAGSGAGSCAPGAAPGGT
ncbi:MAG TPA: zinc ribbon domain-containing protein [Candidatus Limnocylindria bacterium]